MLIVRHAQSTWNAEGRWQGQADPPLSDLGERQARAAARRLAAEDRFDLVVSSDLIRATRTGALIASELGLESSLRIEVGLREYDVGAWSGCTRDEIEERWPGDLVRFSQGELDSPGAGESRLAFDVRVADAGRSLASQAVAGGAQRVLVVAHGGVIRSMARRAGLPDQRTGHLAGYRGSFEEDGLFPSEAVDLLEGDDDDGSFLSL
jgi:probable phosphoglycerate mutase